MCSDTFLLCVQSSVGFFLKINLVPAGHQAGKFDWMIGHLLVDRTVMFKVLFQ